MKKLFIVSCLAVMALSAVGSAKADDFKGFYGGITFGDAIGRSHARTSTVYSSSGYFATTSVPAVNAIGIQRVNPEGFFGGVEAGYNFRFGNIVIGAEGDFNVLTSMSDRKGSTAGYPCCAPDTFTIRQTVANNWLLTARPRVGFTMGRALVYATGGLAETHVKYHSHFDDTYANATESAVIKQNLSGWTVGGGAEYAFGVHLSAKLEYLYASFGQIATTSTNLAAFSTLPFPSNVFSHSDDMHMHIARVGVNYRF